MGSSSGAAGGSMLACGVCPHGCRLHEGSFGICGARTVRSGKVASLSYGQATSLALDPVEKKPFARFHPGSMILSYGSYGCNLRCSFCQNSDISMVDAAGSLPTYFMSPENLIERAIELRAQGNIGVAFTYNEPFAWSAWRFGRCQALDRNGAGGGRACGGDDAGGSRLF